MSWWGSSGGKMNASPGSMGLATDVYGEGLRIPPIRIVRDGETVDDVLIERLEIGNRRGRLLELYACRTHALGERSAQKGNGKEPEDVERDDVLRGRPRGERDRRASFRLWLRPPLRRGVLHGCRSRDCGNPP